MIKIVFDSGCDLNSVIHECGYDYARVPLTLNIDDKSFKDKDLNIEEYLSVMEASDKPAKSAAPSPESYMDAFAEADEIYCVTISSSLSGSYNSAVVAKDLFLEKFPDKKVYIIDSRLATAGQTAIVCKLIEQLNLGLRCDDLIKSMNSIVDTSLCYFILDSFQNLTKNGRMSPMISKIASVMNIKPVCKGENHEISLVFKPRGTKRAYQKLVETVATSKNLDANSTIYITHIQSLEAAKSIKNMLHSKIKVKDIIINDCSGLCATYAERFGLVIGF